MSASEKARSVALKATKLFQPLKVGKNTLAHRAVFAPSTRFRALPDHTPSDLQLEYYDKRSRFPGTLVITEGTLPSLSTGVDAKVPGIYSEKQVEEWKKITDKIHENGSFASVQLWGLGRGADPVQSKKEGLQYRGVSAIYHSQESEQAAKKAGNELEEYTTQEVEQVVQDFVKAGQNAVKAGFDYVELHGATGYLINQFFESSANKRTDKYGGSIENRARFALELIDGLSEAIGPEKVAIRISPWLKYTGMKAEQDEIHPIATFGYFLGQLQKRADAGREIAYVSLIEPRIPGMSSNEDAFGSNAFAKSVWKGILIRSGNYTYDVPDFKQLLEDIDDDRTLAGFSRFFLSNPDLIYKLQDGGELEKYDRKTFYTSTNWGYNTWNGWDEANEFDMKTEKSRRPAPIGA
ncbi:uncharacterized protein CXQ87_004854 [Candidozyma duobushaemuli]|uniref:NADH:flavin oxidoreductase/NADH oxidase N-terminal domain-containing protein n=2 Tax=Candidozyma TaxID=3303203 RepID=A0ABX8IAM2_9ASCO|nr:uncharacterized protein CXQ87_004854 [[Candida] duobushaemulonis]PVH16559.1 hypothetical protein CXQ87_004854 [[Candida] duobushaemulonis]QWU90321.1 hypothetical protein CA3LBN_004682 [[Candida] haemuloni]